MSPFVVQSTASTPSTSKETFAALTLRRAKKPKTSSKNSYMKLVHLIPPTSNRVERLFSQCKLVLTPTRSRLLPVNFEMIMFLRVNRKLWNYASLASYVPE